MTENAIAKEIVDAAFRIHTTLGPGLLESVYDTVWRMNSAVGASARYTSSPFRWSMRNLKPEQSNIFFKLMEERYRQHSTIITTNAFVLAAARRLMRPVDAPPLGTIRSLADSGPTWSSKTKIRRVAGPGPPRSNANLSPTGLLITSMWSSSRTASHASLMDSKAFSRQVAKPPRRVGMCRFSVKWSGSALR
jgi:hypothetical protein